MPCIGSEPAVTRAVLPMNARRRTVSMKASIFVAAALVSIALTTYSQEPVRPPQTAAKSPDETAYDKVNSLDPQSLQDYLRQFPAGQHSQNAKDALELQTLVKKIKGGSIDPDLVIPFQSIGGAGGWALPGKAGFTGYVIQRQGRDTTSGITWEPFDGGQTPGRDVISFDSNGNPAVADTDGSIIAFTTNGIELGYYGGVKFETPGAAPAFFGVIKGLGFVHLKGAVRVTEKGKAPVDLAAAAPVERTGVALAGARVLGSIERVGVGDTSSRRWLMVSLFLFIDVVAIVGYLVWRRRVQRDSRVSPPEG
jgi:hypothetical protein